MLRSTKVVRRVVIGVVMMFVWVVLFVPQQASANGSALVTSLSDINPHSITAHTNGTVTVTDCGWSPQASSIQSWGAGQKITDISSSTSRVAQDCNYVPPMPDPSSNVVYGHYWEGSGHNDGIAAFSGTQRLWYVDFPCQPSNIFGSVMGADGDIYVSYKSVSCYGWSGSTHIIGIDTSSHSVKFNVSTDLSAEWANNLLAYKDGLVFRHNNEFHFFSYAGVENESLLYDTTTTESNDVNSWVVSPSGTVFVAKSNPSTGSCSYTGRYSQVMSRMISGVNRDWNLSSQCVSEIQPLRPAPLGGAVGVVNTESGEARLLLLKANGSSQLVALPKAGEYRAGGAQVDYITGAQVDSFGNILIGANYTHFESGYDTDTEINLFDASGILRARFSTEPQGTAGNDNNALSFQQTPNGIAFSHGNVYVTDYYGNNLYRIPFAELGHEYVANELFDLVSIPVEQLNYVALGDSFSSGEGVEPFFEATDIPPESDATQPNMCHKSRKAYSQLLDQDPALTLNLISFAACSGAKMENITTSGQWNEDPQIVALNAQTDVVTITIGGNDVGFEQAARECNMDPATSSCLTKLTESYTTASSHNFRVAIQSTLAAVKNAAPNATIVVVGYPYILSTPGSASWCGWAFQAVSQAEKEKVEDIVGALNLALSLGAGSLGLEYVDPREAFTGHFPCSEEPYVNGVILTNQRYSYHPTAAGHQRLATLIKSALS